MTTYGRLSQTQLEFTQNGIETSKFVQSDSPFLELSKNDGTNLANIKGTSASALTLSGTGDSGNVLLTGISTPLSAYDAVNKLYVDSLTVSGITWKNSAIAATTTNISNFASVTIIDDVTLSDGDRVVVKNQIDTTENGVYKYNLATLTLSRSSDAAAGNSANGSAIFVYSGTTGGDKSYVVTNDTNVNWDSGVIWSLMSSVTAAGSDTQVIYNNSGSYSASSSFIFNKSTTIPVLSIGSNASCTTATIDIGAGTNTHSVINLGSGTGTTSIDSHGSGVFTMTSNDSVVNLFGTNASNSISIGSGLTSGSMNIGNSLMSGSINMYGGQLNLGNTSTTSVVLLSTGDSGSIQMNTGTASTLNANGGDFNIQCGAGNGTGSGGNVILQAGSSVSGDDGNIILRLASSNSGTIDNIVQFQSSVGSELGKFDNTGKMYANVFQSTSDEKYKTNINVLTNSLSVVKNINGCSFRWKNEFPGNDNKLHFGVIAQQLESIGLGNLVSTSDNSKTVNYMGIIPLLIEAIKELSEKIDGCQNYQNNKL